MDKSRLKKTPCRTEANLHRSPPVPFIYLSVCRVCFIERGGRQALLELLTWGHWRKTQEHKTVTWSWPCELWDEVSICVLGVLVSPAALPRTSVCGSISVLLLKLCSAFCHLLTHELTLPLCHLLFPCPYPTVWLCRIYGT